jgi:hypothetical protein
MFGANWWLLEMELGRKQEDILNKSHFVPSDTPGRCGNLVFLILMMEVLQLCAAVSGRSIWSRRKKKRKKKEF